MRSHAKASSEGSTLRRTVGRKKLGVLALSAALLGALVLITGSAFASKGVIDWIGTGSSGTLGGQFSSVGGVGVNSTGAGGVPAGSIYVADTFNDRIQQFDPNGAFVRAWGFDVIQPGKAGNLGSDVFEVCEVATSCKSGSTIFPTPGGMLPNPRSISVDQTTGVIYVAEEARVQKFSATGAFQAAFGKNVVGGGGEGTEVCTVASECGAGDFGEAGGEFSFSSNGGGLTVAPAGSPNEGDVYVVDPGNRRIQQFDSSGAFVAAFGADVEAPSGGSAFEVCTVAADCIAGSEGNGDGQFSFNSPSRVAADDAGRVYAVDNNNNRVQRFTAAPAFDTIYGTTELSGSEPNNIAIDPGATSAGDASDDHVFVAVQSNSPFERRIEELGTVADPSLIDIHMSDAGIDSVRGLAVDATSGRLFVSSQTAGQRVYFLDEDAGGTLEASIDEVTTATDTSANLTGAVNPEGGSAVCEFEYSTDQSNWTDVPVPGCESLDIDGGFQPISAEVSGLVPNTSYVVRLKVERPFPPLESDTTDAEFFSTDSVPPLVTDVGAVEVEDTSARLVGTIDPRNAESGYVFEYGTTPALGSATAPLAVGGGTTPIVVSRVVSGLAKDTTYYFRLVATNTFGTTPGVQATLHTRTVPAPLPADRSYEQVSPVDKNFGDATRGSGSKLPPTEYVALNGDSVTFGSINSFGDPPGQNLRMMATYISHRKADGWRTQPVFPNACAGHLENEKLLGFFLWQETPAAISANGERAVVPQRESASCETPPLDPAAPTPATNLYRANFEDDSVSYDLLAPTFDIPPAQQEITSKTGEYLAGSDDFSRIYYGVGAENGVDAKFPKIYEWDNGVQRLASVDPNGDPFTTESVLVGPRRFASDAVDVASADGSRFFFRNPYHFNDVGPFDLYMRDSGNATYKITESECTVSCDPIPSEVLRPHLEWASADGEVAIFETPERLLNADTGEKFSFNIDLYLYRHSPNPTAEPNLTLLSEDNEPADGSYGEVSPENSAYRHKVLGMSDDGNVVFFVTEGQLISGKSTAPGPKIYRWSWNEGSPSLQYLGAARNDQQASTESFHIERRVTRSGDTLMIETKAKVDSAADHDDDIDVYLWREGRGWTCTSCQIPGTASGGASTTGRAGPRDMSQSFVERPVARELMSAISEDGERVFFQTQDALVPTDVNGPCSFESNVGYFPCTDIYEWHDGRISLITSGTGSKDLGLIGASADGADVFFYTGERLVGWDKDNLLDVYDARAGGGLPEPPDQPAACEGEACRGASSSTPDSSGAGTAVFQGPANQPDTTRKACPKGKRKVRRAGKTRCVKPRSTAKAKQRNRNRANSNRRAAR